jgi:predicted metalloprotease with PDZ domain
VDGADVPLPERLSEPKLVLRTRERRDFDPGFDGRASAEGKIVKGVREGSAAWKAGLRDGQKILSVNVGSGDATHPASGMVKVQDAEGPREIRFEPLGEPHPVLAYEPESP